MEGGWATGTILCTGCPVLQHTLAESWASQPMGARSVSFLHGCSMAVHVGARLLDGVLMGSHLDFQVRGGNEIRKCLGLPYQQATSISFPLPGIIGV